MFLKVIFLCLLLSVSNAAWATDLFYGLGVVNQKVDISVSDGTTTVTGSESASGLAFFADSYYRSKYRFNGTVSYVNYTGFYTLSATASADYLFPYDDRTTFFIGATGGAISQVYSDSSVSDMALSYQAGIQFGGIWLATNRIMLELGYRQRSTNLETDVTSTGATATIDQLSETYLSANFIF